MVAPGNLESDTSEPDWIWREDKINVLLKAEHQTPLFVSGCKSNQGSFYPQFNYVVLFSAALEVILKRVASRQNNSYGKTPDERKQIARNLEFVEPLLRKSCEKEFDTAQLDIAQLADRLIELAEH